MRVVLAPDSFKGVIDATAAAEAMADGVRLARRDADIVLAPMADGGEGTMDILVDALGGVRRRVPTSGPLGDPVEATIGLVREASTAVIELACAAGYVLVPQARRNPLKTTTFGLGRVMRAVVENDIEEIILTLGGSATVDGGAGMMQALGVTFLDKAGRVMPPGIAGGDLVRVQRIEWDKAPANMQHVQITIANDVLNPACGPNGAARVFGPQKGADAAGVETLDAGLSHWADVLEGYAGRSVRHEPGTGAAGGVALPLLALTSATLTPGVDVVGEAIGLADRIGSADLVLTGEGRLDGQSIMGKVVGSVGRMCRAAGTRCVAIVGCTGDEAEQCAAILDGVRTLDAPLEETENRLREVAREVVLSSLEQTRE